MSDDSKIVCAQCGKSYRWKESLAGRNVNCKCGAMIAVPESPFVANDGFEAPDPFGNIQDDFVAQTQSGATPNSPGFNAEQPDASAYGFPEPLDVPLEYHEAPCAYEPSGAVGNTGTLSVSVLTGVGIGLGVGAACLAGAAGLNWVHNQLPVYIFIVPIVLVILIAGTPFFVGTVGAHAISKGAITAHCRSTSAAMFFAVIAAVISNVTLLVIADNILADGFVGFIGTMVGGAINFEYTSDYKSVNLSPVLVYSIMGAVGLFGVWVGSMKAMDVIKSTPYCEPCEAWHEKKRLWSVAPNHADYVIEALEARDYAMLEAMPKARRKNRADVVLWNCDCQGSPLIEVFGQATIPPKEKGEEPDKKDPVRVFSMPANADEVSRLKAIAAASGRTL